MASGKTLQSTIELSGVLSPSLQTAINGAVDKLSEMSKETLESADAATRLVAEMSAQEDILKTLQRAYAGYAASGEESSEQAQDLAKRIRTVAGELEENRDTLKAAERATDSLADAQEDAAESAENSGEGYTILKDAIADLVADGIEKAVEAFKELATEGDTALAKLEAKTGGVGKEVENVMNEVYNAGYGESLGDVSESLATVIQMTDDLDNASLAKVTKHAMALEDVFGYDTTESLRAANSLMDQFGLTSDQAFNLIVQGAQNGLDQNGDLLDTINEYSVQFRTAGYSANDMFNMLLNGTETGTWSVDKLGDAVKEFNIRMSDGSASDYLEQLGVDTDAVMEKFNKGGPEAQQAIGTVMDAILKCDDATLQYQAGVGLFGTMWEDLGADTVASLMDTQGAISSTADAMEKMDGAAYDTLEHSLTVLGRTIKDEVVKPIADKLIPTVKDSVNLVTDKVGPAVDWLVNNLPYVGIALGAVGAVIAAMKWGSIVSGVGKAVSAFKGIGTAIAAIPGPVLLIIGIVAALAAGFAYLWKTNEGFRESMTGVWEQLQGTFSQLGGMITNTITQLTPLISQIATTVLPAIANVLAVVLPVLLQFVVEILPVIVDLLGKMLPIFVQIAQSVLPVLVEVFNQLLPVIMQIVQTVLPLLLEVVKALMPVISAVAHVITAVLGNAIKQVQPIIQGLTKVFQGLIDFVSGVFSGNWSKAWSGIVKVFGGLWDSLVGIVKAPINGVIALINKAIGALNGISVKIPDWVPKYGGQMFGVNLPKIPQLADGGFTDGVSIAGEAGMEAVISFDPAYRDKNIGIWEKAGQLLGVLSNEDRGGGLTSKAGELLTLDDFSLGSLADGTNVVIYYDFSNFTWSPHVQSGNGEDEDDLMARLKAHEAEFFDWLEEFIRAREVAQYA